MLRLQIVFTQTFRWSVLLLATILFSMRCGSDKKPSDKEKNPQVGTNSPTDWNGKDDYTQNALTPVDESF